MTPKLRSDIERQIWNATHVLAAAMEVLKDSGYDEIAVERSFVCFLGALLKHRGKHDTHRAFMKAMTQHDDSDDVWDINLLGGGELTVIVQILGDANGNRTPHDGRYVLAWNPHTEAGTLALDSTDDPLLAKQFRNVIEVMEERGTVSDVEPVRPWDNEPNRPLCGVNILVMPLGDAL